MPSVLPLACAAGLTGRTAAAEDPNYAVVIAQLVADVKDLKEFKADAEGKLKEVKGLKEFKAFAEAEMKDLRGKIANGCGSVVLVGSLLSPFSP